MNTCSCYKRGRLSWTFTRSISANGRKCTHNTLVGIIVEPGWSLDSRTTHWRCVKENLNFVHEQMVLYSTFHQFVLENMREELFFFFNNPILRNTWIDWAARKMFIDFFFTALQFIWSRIILWIVGSVPKSSLIKLLTGSTLLNFGGRPRARVFSVILYRETFCRLAFNRSSFSVYCYEFEEKTSSGGSNFHWHNYTYKPVNKKFNK